MRRLEIVFVATCIAAGLVSCAGYAADGRHAERKEAPMDIGKARHGIRALPPSALDMSGFSAWSDGQVLQDHRSIDSIINPNESEGP